MDEKEFLEGTERFIKTSEVLLATTEKIISTKGDSKVMVRLREKAEELREAVNKYLPKVKDGLREGDRNQVIVNCLIGTAIYEKLHNEKDSLMKLL